MLGFAATGQSPFGNGPVPAIAFRVVHNEPDLSGIPDELASVIGRCLTKTPAGRPTTQTLLTTLGSLGRDLETSGEHSGGDSDSGGDSGGEGRADHQSSWLPPDLTETISRRATEVLRDPGMPRTTPMGRTDRTRVDESAATDQARQQQQQQEQQQQERSSRTEGGSTGTKSRQEPDRERPPDPGGGVQEGTRGGADGTASGKGTREKASGGQGKGAGAAGTSANERRERPRENVVDEQRRKNDGAAGSATATRRPAEAFQLIPRRAHAAQRRAERRKGLVRLALAPFGFYLLVVLAGLVFSLIQGDRASIGVLFAFAWDVMTSLPLAGFLALIWILSLIDTLTEGMAHGRLEVNAEGIAAVDDRLSPSTDRTVRLPWRDLRRVRLVASGRLYHIVVEFDEDRKKALARQHRLSQKEGGYLLATLHPSSGSERTASVEQLRDAVRRFGALADQG